MSNSRTNAFSSSAFPRSRYAELSSSSGFQRLIGFLFFVASVFLAVFLAGALSTYNKSDLGFSHASTAAEMHNIFGTVGAWTSDLLFLLFGWGAWLFLAGAIVISVKSWKALKNSAEESESNGLRLVAFCILTVSLCTLLFLRFYSYSAGLPGSSGGVIGSAVGTELMMWAGHQGASIVCLVLIFLTVSNVFSFSWIAFVEGIGATIELMIKHLIATKQKYDDNQAGKEQKKKRQKLLEELDALDYAKKGHPKPLPFVPEETAPVSPWKEGDQPIIPTETEEKLARFQSDPQDLPIGRVEPLKNPEEPIEFAQVEEKQEPVEAIEPVEPIAAVDPVLDQQAEEIEDFEELEQISESSSLETEPEAEVLDEDLPVPYKLPEPNLLRQPPYNRPQMAEEELQRAAHLIEKTLESYRIRVQVLSWLSGPIVTMYKIRPAPGTPSAKIVGVAKDLARGLGEASLRVIENMREIDCIGLEVPNPSASMQTIFLKEILGSQTFIQSKSRLTLALGKNISGEPYIIDLAKAPHLLVAGTTGSGKSVGINSMILSLLYKNKPEDLRLMLVDPKVVEFGAYEDIPHLLTPVIEDMDEAANALQWAVVEMDRRYKQMKAAGVRKFEDYNEKIELANKSGQPIMDPASVKAGDPRPLEKFYYIVIIIDELADLLGTHKKQVEGLIVRLAQKARAAGMHLILATQRPSTDVVTPIIKSNCPSRISFQVSSRYDSQTIIGESGAEALLGRGDMLHLRPGSPLTRVHGAFVADEEIQSVCEFLKAQQAPNYVEGVTSSQEEDEVEEVQTPKGPSGEQDTFYDQAVNIVLEERKSSISYLQRRLGVGYNRAAKLMEAMEENGIVSKASENGKRAILVDKPPEY